MGSGLNDLSYMSSKLSMTSKVPGAYYRKYINSVNNCWVLYDKDGNSIKKRTIYKGCHIICRRKDIPYQWADTYYYPISGRDYMGLPI